MWNVRVWRREGLEGRIGRGLIQEILGRQRDRARKDDERVAEMNSSIWIFISIFITVLIILLYIPAFHLGGI